MTKATVGGCFVVEARIDKYISGYPQAFIGPQAKDYSVVTKTAGTFVYHYGRWHDSVMYWDSGWVRG